MVRLVRTDFDTKEDSEYFYTADEFDESQNMFTYSSFKKYSVYLSKYTNDDIYSLNILSKKYLQRNQFLIHISDSEYVILLCFVLRVISVKSGHGHFGQNQNQKIISRLKIVYINNILFIYTIFRTFLSSENEFDRNDHDRI